MRGLPRGWVEASLNEVAKKITDGSHNPPPGLDSGVPMLSAKNIRGGRIWFDEFRRISPEEFERENRRSSISRDDVLMTIVGAIGRTAVVQTDEPFAVQRSVAVIGELTGLLPSYLAKYATGPVYQQWLYENAKGTAQKGVYLSKLAESVIAFPPLAEQKRIVDKLDALNTKSARARTELARIETLVSRYKQAVLSKAFSGEFTREWRYLAGGLPPVEPRHAHQMKPAYRLSLEQVFDAPYDLPTSWEWLTLPSVGDLDRGKSKHRPRNDPRLFDGPFPFIQTGDVRAADQYVREHSQTYSEFGLAQSKLWPPDTLCITIAANIAETALLSYPACFPDSVVGFSADEDKMLPKYAEFFLRTAKERISQFAPATAQKNINLEILAAVRIPVAPLAEQHEIVRGIESAFAKIDRLAKEAKRALELVGRLDEAILGKAFRGELFPQDENDEPAELLLARIRAEREAAPKVKKRAVKRRSAMLTAKDFLNAKLPN